ncbi:MAG: 30S ribosomal protein S16 [Proteobacteria bacterium]|nr:30S ribosomal protein S16 [Pseudomonadota bacterium]
MAVTIRLARHGRKKIPFYRIVACDKQMKRDGRYLELLGTLNPLTNPATINLKEDRVKYWLGVGAQTSDTVSDYLEISIPGYLKGIEEARSTKIRTKRAKRKAAQKKSSPKKVAAKKK